MSELREKLRLAPLFAKLGDEDLEYLEQISQLRRLHKGEILFYKGDAPLKLYLLLEGRCRVYKHNKQGNEIVLKLFEGVSLIAELANLEKMPYPSNCEAQSEALVLEIEYSAFEQHFLNNAHFLLLFVKSLTQKIFNLERIIHSNIALDAPSRVAKYLYENEEEFYEKTNVEIAQHLNITPETLSRVLKKLKNAGILVLRDGVYRVDELERASLEELFEF